MRRSLSEGVELGRALEAAKSAAMVLFEIDPAIHSVGVGRHGAKFGIRAVRRESRANLLQGVIGPGRKHREIAGVPVQLTTVRGSQGVRPLIDIRARPTGALFRSGRIPEQKTASPLFCGVQIQNFDNDERRGLLANNMISVGTLGCFVQTNERKTALLSNNHILGGSNLAAMNDRILHAGASRWGIDSIWVADLSGRIPLNHTPPGTPAGSQIFNTADAAYAILQDGVTPEPGFHPRWECPEITHIAEAVITEASEPPQRVFKVGRTTGKRSGEVVTIDAIGPLFYPKLGECWFQDVVWVRSTDDKPFADVGDSGSLVVDDLGGAIGLVFAADSKFTYVCPLGPILQQLECKLLTRDGPVGPKDHRRIRSSVRAPIVGETRWGGGKK